MSTGVQRDNAKLHMTCNIQSDRPEVELKGKWQGFSSTMTPLRISVDGQLSGTHWPEWDSCWWKTQVAEQLPRTAHVPASTWPPP